MRTSRRADRLSGACSRSRPDSPGTAAQGLEHPPNSWLAIGVAIKKIRGMEPPDESPKEDLRRRDISKMSGGSVLTTGARCQAIIGNPIPSQSRMATRKIRVIHLNSYRKKADCQNLMLPRSRPTARTCRSHPISSPERSGYLLADKHHSIVGNHL